jgi:hypothetical protein
MGVCCNIRLLAHILIICKDPEHFKTYYNEERQCLEHSRFPSVFFRTTKTAYVSIADEQLLRIAQKIGKKYPHLLGYKVRIDA